ncbi:MAG: amino acid racemase [Candidatus Sabulitectum sp.]|nr:amino acid racemase [Candidatus Sabulitectum sp.]
MSKHIGIVACSAEGAALCYRTICSEAKEAMGDHMHPEITMHTHPLGKYMIAIRSGNWRQVADLMLSSTKKLKNCGADFVISPDNTIHQAFSIVKAESPIPWIHIADAVASQALKLDLSCLAITGTKYLMTGPVYPETLKKHAISCRIPTEKQRERINDIIFNELVYGTVKETSRLYFNEVIQELKEKGCDGVVLGCTEIPLIVRPSDCPLPTLDSTRLLARLALQKAME